MTVARIPVITQKQVAPLLAPRPRDSHKGQFGTVAIIGGSNGMIGAALLAGRASLKLGAGCVHVGLLADNAPGVDTQQVELMLHNTEATLQLPKLDVIAIGCGMGHDLRAQKILHDALKLDTALVLDADALNILAARPDLRSLLLARKAPSVITPHPGEAARLLGIGTDAVQAARPASALELAKRLNCSVVLKGAGSLCVTRDAKIWLNNTGNPGMSGPGMGDVLSGMIAAFIAQGLSADNAILLAVHLHGAAGDALAQQQASIGMTASEVTEWARWLLNQWLK
ncbi:MAG TPA: NAD(P)H-hydrate dehydratase [Gallionellaceae bacterium]|nr:NAD(P)H-hydrate dehydratase [Gallionellaceae bacterium]